jgi:hypothetical protein
MNRLEILKQKVEAMKPWISSGADPKWIDDLEHLVAVVEAAWATAQSDGGFIDELTKILAYFLVEEKGEPAPDHGWDPTTRMFYPD